jgi:hypothetical protein
MKYKRFKRLFPSATGEYFVGDEQYLKPEDVYRRIWVSPDLTDEELTRLVWYGYQQAEKTGQTLVGNVREYLEQRRDEARAKAQAAAQAEAQAAAEAPEEEGNR